MRADDADGRALGTRPVAQTDGAADVAMTVRDDRLNGFAMCHDGLVATLADTAFALVCDSAV